MFDIGLLLILLLGVLLGALIASAEFRRKFFVGFRNFLRGLNLGGTKGQKIKEKHYAERNVQRRYTRTHVLEKCPVCGGTGQVKAPAHKLVDERLVGVRWINCPECDGEGEVEVK